MKVLVIGSGAREHALAWAAAKNSDVTQVFVAPGNGGTALMGGKVHNLPLKASDIDGLLEFSKTEGIDLTIVGPEQPLEQGIVDRFREARQEVIGPVRAAAQLETSKVFAKEFMKRYGIPTASYQVFTDAASAGRYLASLVEGEFPQVLKASGLCAGKGVVVASDLAEAQQALGAMFDDRVFGDAASEVVIESFLKGEEASVFVLTDGTDYRFFLPSQDHKRIGEGDTGKNTGGMGAYAPAPVVTPAVLEKVEERIVRPVLEGMKKEGTPYTGFLYIGLMIDNGEPSVVEFNVRLGDPEAQVVLPLCKDDLVDALLASIRGGLSDVPFGMLDCSAATVVLASGGYPDQYETGKAISIAEPASDDVMLFHAGTTLQNGVLETSGGRVISVTAVGDSLQACVDKAYAAVDGVAFEGAYHRRDIGFKAL